MEILQIICPSKDLSGTRYRDKLKASSPSRKSKSCHICVHCASGQWPPPDATVLCGSCISHCSSDGDDGGDGGVAGGDDGP